MIQSLANGLIDGLLLAVVALGFSLVFATTRIFFIAIGAVFALSPYLALTAREAGLSWLVSVMVSVAVGSLISVLAEELVHWPLEAKRASSEVQFIASLGVYLVVLEIVGLTWGSDTQVLLAGVDSVFELPGVRLTAGQVLSLTAGSSMLAISVGFLWWTDLGLQLRGLACNQALLSTLGRNVRALRRTAFLVCGALVSAAALAFARDVGFEPGTGMPIVLAAVAACIVGGRSSYLAAAMAAVFLGILRSQVTWLASAKWADAATFAVLAATLLMLPGGVKSIADRARGSVERP